VTTERDAQNCLEIERRGPLLILSLNRPQALNSLDGALVDALLVQFEALQHDHDVRVVLLRGVGRAFCAGLDIKAWSGASDAITIRRALENQQRVGRIMRLMRSCPQPIIALGQGAACGGGFSLLLACDVRYAAPSLRMNAAYIKIGLGGCDIGSSYFLPRLVGASLAAELLLTGRFIDAQRALRVGLVSEIVEDDLLLETGLELAAEMLRTSPLGLRLTKDALNLNIDAQGLEAAMALEDRQQVMLATTRDHREALEAFIQKRLPLFQDC